MEGGDCFPWEVGQIFFSRRGFSQGQDDFLNETVKMILSVSTLILNITPKILKLLIRHN